MKEILLYNVISNDSFFGMGEAGLIDRVVTEIKDAQNEDILLRLSTPGGSIFQGQAIIRNLQEHEGKVNIIVDGLAASMGGVMLAFADNVIADKFSRIMLHKGYGGDGSKETTALIDSLNSQFADLFKAKGIDSELIDKIFLSKEDKDYWFTAEEALAIGLVDEISDLGIKNKLVATTTDLVSEYYNLFGNKDKKHEVKNMNLFNAKEKKEFEDKITALTDEVTNLTNANSDLNVLKASLEEDNEKINKEINDLNEANATTDNKVVDTNAKIEALVKENAALKSSIESNETIMQDVLDQVKQVKDDFADLVATIRKTNTTFEVEKTQNGEVVDSMKGFNEEINAINKGIK